MEWNETIKFDTQRGVRGGSYVGSPDSDFAAGTSGALGWDAAGPNLGFRLASVPEPGTGLLMLVGILGFAVWRMST